MKKFMTWLFLLTKRQLKNPVILCTLIIIPAVCFFVNRFTHENSSEVSYIIGVYVQGNDDVSDSLADALYDYEGAYDFIPYDNEDMLYKDVTNRTLICGYILPEDLSRRINGNDMSDSITVLIQPDVTIQGAINEIVFSQLIKVQGLYIITDYVHNMPQSGHMDVDYASQLKRYYDSYLRSDVTFHMKYSTYGTNGTKELEDAENATVVFPARGILSILVFLAGIFGGILYLRDKEKGVFGTVSAPYKNVCLVLYTFIPALLFSIVMLLSIGFLGIFTKASTEIMSIIFYTLLIAAFTILLVKILKKSSTLSALLPVLLLCCIIFCPVFIDAGRYVPAAKFIQKLFIPYYYLRFFT